MEIFEIVMELLKCVTYQIADKYDDISIKNKGKIGETYTEYDNYYILYENDFINYGNITEDIIINYTYPQINNINNNLITNNITDRQIWYKSMKCLYAVYII